MPEEDSSLGARLRESEARYRSVVEAMTEGVVLQSRDGTILACNSSATRILGLTEGQMKGRTSHDPRWRSVRADGSAYPGEEHPAMVTLRTGTPIREAVMGVHKADGTLTWIEINTEPLFEHGDPTPHAVVASFSDITAHRALVARLKESDERTRLALSAARMGVWEWDTGQTVSWSRDTEEIFGVEPGTFEGTFEAFASFIHPDDREWVPAQIWAALEDPARGDQFAVDHRIVRPDGQTRWLECRGRVYRDDAGNPIKMTGLVRDRTAQREVDAQLVQAQKMQTVGRLAGGIAHDFNNLLTAIRGAIDLAEEGGDQRHENLQIAREALEHAGHLTRQLLTFARKQPVHLRPLELREVLASVATLLQRLLPENICVELNLDGDLWNVLADRVQLEQILVNLALNAGDAMPRGGRLTISVRNAREPAAWTDEHIEIVVKDEGTGIAEADLPHVFDAFYTTKEQGTGLGLATVHGIVQELHGSVAVKSELGAGTEVTVRLPRCMDASAMPVVADVVVAEAEGRTVLAVEDNALVLRSLCGALRARGYTVLQAEDGPGALRAAESHAGRIDALITDVVLPGMTGPELAAILRTRRPDLQVLYVSGYPGEALDGLAESCELMRKPYSAGEVAAVLARMIAGDRGSPGVALGTTVPRPIPRG